MSLATIFDFTEDARRTLSGPPPYDKTRWREYRALAPLLSERHGAAISLLKEGMGDLSQTYTSDLRQTFINDVFMGGVRYITVLDREIKALVDLPKGNPIIERYLFALSLLRENLDGTIRFYFRLKGQS